MKREDMVLRIMEMLIELPEDVEAAANEILNRIEKAGMRPPSVGSDQRQVLMQIYVYPDFNMWDEQFFGDDKLVDGYIERMNSK